MAVVLPTPCICTATITLECQPATARWQPEHSPDERDGNRNMIPRVHLQHVVCSIWLNFIVWLYGTYHSEWEIWVLENWSFFCLCHNFMKFLACLAGQLSTCFSFRMGLPLDSPERNTDTHKCEQRGEGEESESQTESYKCMPQPVNKQRRKSKKRYFTARARPYDGNSEKVWTLYKMWMQAKCNVLQRS